MGGKGAGGRGAATVSELNLTLNVTFGVVYAIKSQGWNFRICLQSSVTFTDDLKLTFSTLLHSRAQQVSVSELQNKAQL